MKNLQKKYLLFKVLFILNASTCFSQGKIKIIVSDSLSKTPIEFANIELKEINTSKLIGGLTNIGGEINVSCTYRQFYLLSISYIGYLKYTNNLNISNDTTLSILLKPSPEMLEEIIVKGKKAVLENKPDRLVYNVNSKDEKGKSVSEVMRKIPFVIVTNNALLVKGNSNYKILQNGNPSNLTLLDLNNMPSSMVESIELITAPSAKFEGNYENIINVILRKNTNFHGGTSYARISNRTSSIGLSVTNNTPKMNTSYSINSTYDRLISGSETENIFTKDRIVKLSQSELTEKKTPSFSTKFSTEIKISENKFLGFGARFNLSKDNIQSLYSYSVDSISQQNKITNTISTNSTDFGIDANYSQKIGTNQKIYLSNFLSYNKTLYALQSYNVDKKLDNSNNTKTLIYTSQIDYELSMKNKVKIDIGGKLLIRNYNNAPEYNQVVGDPLKYSQFIYATYGSFSKNFKNSLFRLGVRLEQTNNTFYNSNSIFNILPNLLYSIKPTESITVRFAYRKRLQRPSFRILNNFINKDIPFTESMGNPDLKNETYDLFEIENSLIVGKSNISISLSHTNGNDLISSRKLINSYQTSVVYGNLSSSQVDEGLLSLSTPLLKDKIYFTTSGSLKYYKISSTFQKNEGLIQTFNIGISANPTPKLSIDFFTNYLPNGVFLQGTQGNSIFMDFSARYRYKKSSFLIQINNPIIDKINESYNNIGDGFIFSGNNYYFGRAIALGFAYGFGKTKEEAPKTKNIKNTDLKESDKF